MTYCLGIKVASGLVAIADTRLTSGTEYFYGPESIGTPTGAPFDVHHDFGPAVGA